MAVKLHRGGFAHAKELNERKFVYDERDAWSEHQLPRKKRTSSSGITGWRMYGKWHPGIDDDEDTDTKAHYRFPYGDFKAVHRCGVLAAESRAGQYKYPDIESAAAHLHGMIESKKQKVPAHH
jgi:hypothetical protein